MDYIIKADFGRLDDLSAQFTTTMLGLENEKESWGATAGLTEEGWLDHAGGAFGDVSKLWMRFSADLGELLAAVNKAVALTKEEMIQAVARSRTEIEDVSPLA